MSRSFRQQRAFAFRSAALTLCVQALGLLGIPAAALALNPRNTVTQYTGAMWTQADGLPQDTIRAIAQTGDGYLWLGTDEGISRFDGYEFVNFTKDGGSLPNNAIEALAEGRDNTLWIGTPSGLVRYQDKHFKTFTTADGLPDNFIIALHEDHTGALWVVSGVYLSRFEHGKFTNYRPAELMPVRTPRAIFEDESHTLMVAGIGGLVTRTGDRFESVISVPESLGQFVTVTRDHNGNVWIGGRTLVRHSPAGETRIFTRDDGLPGTMIRAVIEDRDGNIWAGATEGLARFDHGRFIAQTVDGRVTGSWVRCMFEDREGNLWIGMNSGLYRFRDDPFTNYGRPEGMPSDEPIAVHQDHAGHIWIGYHGDGLVEMDGDRRRVYTAKDGLLSGEIFSIRETRSGDLLVMARSGVSRLHNGRFSTVVAPHATERSIFDVLEDRRGTLWAAASGGVYKIENGELHNVVPLVPGGPYGNDTATTLCETADGSIWAGTYGEGLWRIDDEGVRRFTTQDGLSSDRIRTLYLDPDGSLWIGTFGGGLNVLRNGEFRHFTAHDGLLSDNIAHIDDDGAGTLWLATTRGICRIPKDQLRRHTTGELRTLRPINYTAVDGLRSAQCAPGYPIAAGGTRSSDGRIWFPTTRGLAVYNPEADRRKPVRAKPVVHLVDARADGVELGTGREPRIAAGFGHVEFRYAAIHLTAPERVRYEYMLEGLDSIWSQATDRRVVSYNTLGHGVYRFRVRASAPDGPAGASEEAAFSFEVLPHFYERGTFLWVCVASLLALFFALYQLRLTQIRGRFSLVLEERTRIAREIHDTLAQGFVGISSQLDAVALEMHEEDEQAWTRLETARRMARHSLTEAKRSVMDLRAPDLQDRDLGAALRAAAGRWQMSASIPVQVALAGDSLDLPADVQQHVLRIAQEAVANAVKHAHPSAIRIELAIEPSVLVLKVSDNGQGFALAESFSVDEGHFGLLGMRERAERLGGTLDFSSAPGAGTLVTVSVPLPRRKSRSGVWQNLFEFLRTRTSHAR